MEKYVWCVARPLPSYISYLPPEVLLNIFSYLDQESLNAVHKVCQSWRHLRRHVSLYRVLEFKNPTSEPIDLIRETLRCAPRLKSLTLMEVDTILDEVASQNQLLTTLVIEECHGSLDREPISAAILKRLLVKLPYLQHLQIKHSSGITESFLSQLGPRLPDLKSVSLHVRSHFASALIMSLADNCPTLQELKLNCIYDDITNGWSFDEDIGYMCDRLGPSLISLELNSGFWSSAGYRHLAKCVNLKHLSLRYAFRMNELNVYLLCRLPSLLSLELSLNVNIGCGLWEYWLQSPAMKNLESLSLIFCNLSDRMGRAIGKLKMLKKLRLVGTDTVIRSETYDNIIMNCTNLKCIEFIFLGRTIEHCLTLIPRHLPQLERLVLTPQIEERTLNNLQYRMPNLQVLEDVDYVWETVVRNVHHYVFSP